jgi:hypothetical protein
VNGPDHCVYIYAVVPERTTVVSSIASAAEVRLIRAGDLCFVVGSADLDALARVNDAASDPRELAELAQSHDAVIRAVMAVAESVIPFRLGTVLNDDRAVRAYATAHMAEMAGLLDRLAGSAEWGVRVSLSAQRLPASRPEPAGTRPGTAHLVRRRQELADAERRRRDRATSAAAVAEELRTLAADATHGQGGGAAILDESYLVRHTHTGRFLGAAERLGAQLASDDLLLRVTGPWPPYSFARLADSHG